MYFQNAYIFSKYICMNHVLHQNYKTKIRQNTETSFIAKHRIFKAKKTLNRILKILRIKCWRIKRQGN